MHIVLWARLVLEHECHTRCCLNGQCYEISVRVLCLTGVGLPERSGSPAGPPNPDLVDANVSGSLVTRGNPNGVKL